jgi:tetratricopeptide (TPR) repeat protein
MFTLIFSGNILGMRKLLIFGALLLTINAMGQGTAQDYFRAGLQKHKHKDYKGAIKEYSKALDLIPKYRDALYNRGNCEMELKQYEEASNDYTAALDADPKFAKGYFSRAYLTFTIGNHADALPDLDKVIELDMRMPNALSLRGQIRAETKNRRGACEDFYRAKALGDTTVLEFIEQVCAGKTTPEAIKK